ncbi:MAG: redox protein [Sphingomonas sp. SCN 67-18]|uniref:sulfurtransferase TusA family protein n=1 Tax=uncultured Sphingomonas sp. TaxID=158754 RepID=UPI00086955A7|nr:sulfurtransferase TusA family protein [Sphingomonas sp. SCN 67-18]ODU18894.1 MAG: redox protein [Sphingomonas sp. SCN 67-18]
MSPIDARGMRCPWPALRLARAMREAAEATIVADDPAAAGEFRALADQQGWALEAVDTAIGPGHRACR